MKTPSLKGITQATPEAERTLAIPLGELEELNLLVGVEKVGGATGTVQIWAHEVTASDFALIESVDLGSLTEKDYTPLDGPFDKFRAVPVGVTGSFNFSCVAR